MRRVLGRLAQTILTLCDDLGPNWDRTTILAIGESGRTAHENGSAGTDRGTGVAMLVAGGAVRGGRALGEWLGLGQGDLHEGRDLMPMRDMRAYAAWAMHEKFGIPRTTLEEAIFPGLGMGPHPKLLA